MRIAVTFDPVEPADPSLSGWIQVLTDDGTPAEQPCRAADLAATIVQRERADTPRWVWAATETDYPRLLDAGVRVERCHDIALTEALLLARAGRFGEPRSLAAAWARLRGLPVPQDPRPVAPQEQTALFGIEASGTGAPDASQQLEMLVAVHADQLRRIGQAGAAPDAGSSRASAIVSSQAGHSAANASGVPGTSAVVASSAAETSAAIVSSHAGHSSANASRVSGTSAVVASSAAGRSAAIVSSHAGHSSANAGPRGSSPTSTPIPNPVTTLATLVAAESAGGLVAAEIAARGVPWRVEAHDAVLTDLLGPRPFGDALPPKLAELGVRVGEAFGYAPGRGFNPDSPTQVLRALRHAGFSVNSTRAWELRAIKHPGVELLLEYKELSRLHAAHGWAWQDAWVKDGRYRPEYVVGGVVSGRWATRNSGALQIPRIMRRAVIADDGWSLVVADAGQLEPRVLAAVSNDAGLARAAASGDLYAALAAEAFDGDRAAAKLALLGAMYGQTSGGIGPLLSVLRKRFPAAMAYVEDAARTGERGGVVYSRLGRACPPPSSRWRRVVSGMDGVAGADVAVEGDADVESATESDVGFADVDANAYTNADADGGAASGFSGMRSGQAARSRGRFTRNFVIQASAADWASVWLAVLRRRLAEIGSMTVADALTAAPHLVFFVHDEVVVHTPKPLAEQAAEAVLESADEARRMVFGPTPVRFPLATAIVDCYADAK